jgi:hypothetical protein
MYVNYDWIVGIKTYIEERIACSCLNVKDAALS